IMLYLASPEHSIPDLMKIIKEYSVHSGYKINESKCEVMCIGKQVTDKFKGNLRFKWNQNAIKYLGVVIHNDPAKMYEANYQNTNKI
uniref:Reverse transcriptase domain-containing protein n=1 Tax=Myripristis murdjan TaxID=586833 RepID=A0A667XQY7_9TELE